MTVDQAHSGHDPDRVPDGLQLVRLGNVAETMMGYRGLGLLYQIGMAGGRCAGT